MTADAHRAEEQKERRKPLCGLAIPVRKEQGNDASANRHGVTSTSRIASHQCLFSVGWVSTRSMCSILQIASK